MSKQNFEDDLDAVFGERGAEFPPKLREMLYELWREGRKRGAEYERTVQVKQMQSLPKTPLRVAAGDVVADMADVMEKTYKTATEWVQFDSLPPEKAAPKPQSHRETFGQILAGKEPVIETPPSTQRRTDYLGREIKDPVGQEFFGQFSVRTKKTKI